MLLSAHAHGDQFARLRFRLLERAFDGLGGSVAPGVRMLFLRAGREVGNQIVAD